VPVERLKGTEARFEGTEQASLGTQPDREVQESMTGFFDGMLL